MDRRAALKIVLAAGVSAPAVGACGRSTERGTMSQATPQAPDGRMPAVFVAHGAPISVNDREWLAELQAWAQAMPRPKSILMLSAHWLDQPLTLGATRTVPLVYDFYGFPEELYRIQYAAPGDPALARRVRELLAGSGPVAEDPERGLDHGAYVPLLGMYPDASVPVLQVSIPTMDPPALLALGRALAPLRREGVLIMGSGFLTHNLRAADLRSPSPVTPAWATEFDAWSADVLARQDVDALLDYRRLAPGVRMALPTHEHFVPVVVAMGASVEEPAEVRFPMTGFSFGSMTRRSVQFG